MKFRCKSCRRWKNAERFYVAPNGKRMGVCRLCDQARHAEAYRARLAKCGVDRKRVRCPDGCCGLPWRVIGTRCGICGLEYAPEPEVHAEVRTAPGNLARIMRDSDPSKFAKRLSAEGCDSRWRERPDTF